jgi:hypothetical protein
MAATKKSTYKPKPINSCARISPRLTEQEAQNTTYSSFSLLLIWPLFYSSKYREKNCRRGRLRPRQDNLKDVEGFAAKVYTTIRDTD